MIPARASEPGGQRPQGLAWLECLDAGYRRMAGQERNPSFLRHDRDGGLGVPVPKGAHEGCDQNDVAESAEAQDEDGGMVGHGGRMLGRPAA